MPSIIKRQVINHNKDELLPNINNKYNNHHSNIDKRIILSPISKLEDIKGRNINKIKLRKLNQKYLSSHINGSRNRISESETNAD